MKYGIWTTAKRRLVLPDDEFGRGLVAARLALYAAGWLVVIGVGLIGASATFGLIWR